MFRIGKYLHRLHRQLLGMGRVPEQDTFIMMTNGVSVRQPLARRIIPNRRFRV